MVVWSRCWAWGGPPAFWPWIELLRALAGDFEAVRAAMDDAGQVLHFAGTRTGADSPDPGERFLMFDAVSRVLRRISSDRTVVLLIDDIHSADAAALELLTWVCRHLHGARLLMVATCRTVSRGSTPDIDDHFEVVGRIGQHIQVDGLRADAVIKCILPRSGLFFLIASNLSPSWRVWPL